MTFAVCFAIDEEASLGIEEFADVELFSTMLIDNIDDDVPNAQFAAIAFSVANRAIARTLTDADSAIEAFADFQPAQASSRPTFTAAGLLGCALTLRRTATANRVIVVVTDGEPGFVDPDFVLPSIGRIGAQVVGVGVGVGDSISSSTLENFSGEGLVFQVPDFDSLGGLVDEVFQQIQSTICN